MTLLAAKQALETKDTVSPERVAVAIGTGLGSLNDTAAFVENMIQKDERVPRPALFTNSVHNALASQVAIEEHFAGLNATPVQREITFETALWQAATELKSGRADLALAGAVDELNPYHLAAGARWGWWSDTPPGRSRPVPGEGCAVFALKRPENADTPLAYVSAIRIGHSEKFDPETEARWIMETLQRDGISPAKVDHLLAGANGWKRWDDTYEAVSHAFSRLTGRAIQYSAYKQGCGEFYSASAFGLLAAVSLLRGEISPGNAPKSVVLLTLSPTGTKGMCCIRA